MINAVFVAAEESAPNPLLPATYDIVWSAVVFVIILIAFWKVFLPKLQAMLDARAEAIEGNIAKAEAALQEYTAQLASARQEAGEIREAARVDATKIVAKAKDDAVAEASRVTQAAQVQIEAERQSAVVSLRKDVGSLAIDLASGVVGESLTDDQRASALVDRFLNDLEASEKAAQ